jgi:hypothetical protein
LAVAGPENDPWNAPQTGERQMTDPPDGINDAKIDLKGRMKMPAELSRYIKQFGYLLKFAPHLTGKIF